MHNEPEKLVFQLEEEIRIQSVLHQGLLNEYVDEGVCVGGSFHRNRNIST